MSESPVRRWQRWRLQRRLRAMERAEDRRRASAQITASGSNVIAGNVVQGDLVIEGMTVTGRGGRTDKNRQQPINPDKGDETDLTCVKFAP